MSELNKLAIAQLTMILRDTMKKDPSMSTIALPDNLSDMMYQTMCQQVGEGTLVSVRDIAPCRIPLPFMPDRIDYKIGQGCCDEIVKRDCLFVPCSHHCDDGNKCAKHLKESTGLGDYWTRREAWVKKELYCVEINDKELKEKPYGTYLHSKKLDSVAVDEEIKKWGIPLKLPADLFRAPAKPLKKNRGRRPDLKVEAPESDSGSESEAEEEPEAPAASEEENSETEKEVEVPEKEEKEVPEKEKVLKKKAPPKPRAKKPLGTPLDGEGELKKEEMEEKVPKKGKYRGKKESLKEMEHDGTKYLTKDGKYYDMDTTELIAYTKNGEFTLL
jgi:hypothetical protein